MRDLLILKLEAISMFLFSLFAIVQPNQEMALMGWAVLGSLLGGAVFAYWSQAKSIKEWMLRWAINVAAGVATGLTIGYQYSSHFPNLPISIFVMICAFFGGPLTVIAIPIGLPIIKNFISTWIKVWMQNRNAGK
jgi:hypothetical protein